ncbi:MAG: HzsA-related protein [Planctomycetota bacterium]|jgi:hypothetical protein
MKRLILIIFVMFFSICAFAEENEVEQFQTYPALAGIDKLLFIKRYTYQSSHYYTDHIDGCEFYGGNICILDMKTGQVNEVIPSMKHGIFGRYDLSFDATKIVFDWKGSEREGFRIYEVNIDGTGLRQLTFPPADEEERIQKYDNSYLGGTGRIYHHQTDDMHPCYLPDGGICFTSSRCEYGILCDAPDILSTAVLYRMDGDGKNMVRLTNSAVSEFSPAVMNDGRIIYSRWEYVDKGQIGIKCLWAMRPDGSASVEIFGNDIPLPPVFIHPRPIPGRNDLFVTLGTPHYPQSGLGTVIRLDINHPIRTRKPMTYVTPETDVQQEGGWVHFKPDGEKYENGSGPLFMDPYPLSEKLFLATYNPDKYWKTKNAYSLYLIDDEGRRDLIYRDPNISCWMPMPLRQRKTPPVIPSALPGKITDDRKATLMLSDVYVGLPGIERGTVKYLRIMEQVPRPWDCRRFWDKRNKDGSHTRLVSNSYGLGLKVMHGIVPVYEDGSAHFVVEANKNLYFQALDENFMEIQRMRTYINLLPGEQRSCIGCHEYRQLAPANKRNLALANAPVEPVPQPGDKFAARTIHYQTDVQPILDSHCVKCHSGKKPKGKLNLTGKMTKLYSVSYENILRKKLVKSFREASDFGGSEAVPPKTIGSHNSKLITKIRAGHKGVKLSREEFIRLVTWVDASAQYYGSYYGRRNIKHKDHPNFRPTHSFEQAVSTTAPLVMNDR